MPEILTFKLAFERTEKAPHLLLGNGFSRACRNDIFAYDSLFQRADFETLSSDARATFEALDTTDFELVMKALRRAATLIKLYESDSSDLALTMERDADNLREVLVNAIATSHPALPAEIAPPQYAACRGFLSNFKGIYSLNYDLLLYWALMQSEINPPVNHDDGFRTPDDGPHEYVTWDIEKSNSQNVHYLHGALHIFDAGNEIKKYTWINTHIRLIAQIRNALTNNFYPLFVAEGDSEKKMERIKHSDWLSRSYRSFANIGGSLFVYGHSFAENDEHILKLIEKGKVSKLFVSIFGDPDSLLNRRIIARAERMADERSRRKPLEVTFFDAESAAVWG